MNASYGEPAAREHAEMPRHVRTAHAELVMEHVSEEARAVLSGGKNLDDPKADRFGKQREDIHRRTIAISGIATSSVIDDGVLDDRERSSQVIGEPGQDALRVSYQLTGRALPSSYPAALWKPTTARS